MFPLFFGSTSNEAADQSPPLELSDVVPWVGLGLLLVSLVLFAGWFLLRRAGRVPAGVVRDIRQQIAERSLPFSVCTDCRVIIDVPVAVACPRCTRMSGCITVRTEDDRGMAAAAVGSG